VAAFSALHCVQHTALADGLGLKNCNPDAGDIQQSIRAQLGRYKHVLRAGESLALDSVFIQRGSGLRLQGR